ncbi:MAG: dihydrolipoamide acetyltransferase family protein [Actinomycetota bacterium]
MTTVSMPQLGETVVEGTILSWLKKEGDIVALDEPLFEISTDKVDTEVPSPAAGVLKKILVPEGQTVAVNTPLAEIEEVGAGAGGSTEAGSQPESAQPAASGPVIGPAEAETTRGAGPGSAPASVVAAPAAATLPDRGPRSRVLSPLVRRLAEENDVDLSQIVGSGTGGRITKTDVLAFVASRAQAAPGAAPLAAAPTPAVAPAPAAPAPVAPPTPAAVGAGEEVVPVSHIRKLIAEHMTRSLQVSARAWNAVEVDMESVARLRERAKEAFKAREGFNLTYMPFVSRAVTDALLAYPMVNAEMRGDQIVLKHYVNLGIAVSYEDGLIVPAVKGAESMNLVGLARAINDVATRARAKKLKPDEVHGGTFTITNPGPFGSLISVPIINQPETAILAFDTVEKRPVVVDDAIAIRHMVYLSLSWDHRVTDGALASQFLVRVKQNLETWDFAVELGL